MKELFIVKRVRADSDGLRHAEVEWLDNWQEPRSHPDFLYLSHQLAHVYEQFPHLNILRGPRPVLCPSHRGLAFVHC